MDFISAKENHLKVIRPIIFFSNLLIHWFVHFSINSLSYLLVFFSLFAMNNCHSYF